MKKMLGPAMENANMRRKTGTISKEEVDFSLMREIHNQSLHSNWSPGMKRMSTQDHEAVFLRLQQKSAKLHVAVTID
jgi:hypothetical protein